MASKVELAWRSRWPREMNHRAAASLAKEITFRNPALTCEVWGIAQGLAYIKVAGPTTRGVVDLVLKDRIQAEMFLELLNPS